MINSDRKSAEQPKPRCLANRCGDGASSGGRLMGCWMRSSGSTGYARDGQADQSADHGETLPMTEAMKTCDLCGAAATRPRRDKMLCERCYYKEWRRRQLERSAQWDRERKALRDNLKALGLTGHLKSKVERWAFRWDGVHDMSPSKFADRLVRHVRSTGRNPFDRRKALLEESGIGKVTFTHLRDWLNGRGKGDLLPKPGERPPPVPRCPHCNQRLPKDKR